MKSTCLFSLFLFSACVGDLDLEERSSHLDAGFSFSRTSLVTSEYQIGAGLLFSINTQPTDDVTVSVTSQDTSEGTVNVSSVTFTNANWATAKEIVVTGVDDAVRDGDIQFTVTMGAAVSNDPAYNGVDPTDITVLNQDNEQPYTVEVSITGQQRTTESGGTKTFKMRLPNAPTANVTCDRYSTDTTEGTVSPTSITFTPTNYHTYQTITVTGVDDAIVDGNVNYTIINQPCTSSDLWYNGSNPVDLSFSNTDND